jgi:hypothetical protein
VLQAQRVQANQSVIFLSDGGETVRNLPEFLIPESEHWLDWFHITLRLTGIGQMIKGLVEVPESSALSGFLPTDDEFTNERVSIAALEKKRESMKWNVWNGNVTRALERTEELVDDLETWPPTADKVVKLKKAVNEFASYIAVNQASIPNYGDRRQHGERIASLCGVGGQSGGEQTDGKKATNEVERARRPFALASTHTGIEWRPPPVVRSLAPRYGRRSRTRATG